MKVSHAVLYEQDFGGPVGMRLAVRHPEWIDGLVFQNTPISLDGWNPERLNAIVESQKLPLEQRRLAIEKRFVPAADIHYYQTGHFALEEDADDIARQIVRTFARNTRKPFHRAALRRGAAGQVGMIRATTSSSSAAVAPAAACTAKPLKMVCT